MTCYKLIELATTNWNKLASRTNRWLIFASLECKRCGLVLPRLDTQSSTQAKATQPVSQVFCEWPTDNSITQRNAYRLLATYRSGFRTLSVALHVHDEAGTQKAYRRAAFEEFHHIFFWAKYHTDEQVEWSHGSAPASTSITRSLARPVATPTAMKPSIFLRCSCQPSITARLIPQRNPMGEVIPSNHWSRFRVTTRWGSHQLPSV